MQNLARVDDSLANKITYYHLLLFLGLLPFDQFYSQIVLISLVIHSIIHFNKADLQHNFKTVVVLQSVFLTSLLCLLYTTNFKEGLSILTRQSAIFLFPLIFLINPINFSKYKNQLLTAFALTCTFTVLYLYIDAFRIISYYNFPIRYLFSSNFINHNFSLPIGLHATYFSLFIALSIVIIIDQVSKNKKERKLLLIICVIILIAGLLQSASKSILVALLLLLFILLVKNIKNSNLKWAVAIAIAALLVFSIIIKIPVLKDRYFDSLQHDLSNSKELIVDSRFDRWVIAANLIKESPVVGFGTGDEVKILKEEYFNNKLYSSFLNEMNVHNQYLSFLLTGGVFALIIYLATLTYCLRLAIKKNDFVFISLVILLIIVSFSENYLYRNKGIFLYSFFLSFFLFLHDYKIKFHRQPV